MRAACRGRRGTSWNPRAGNHPAPSRRGSLRWCCRCPPGRDRGAGAASSWGSRRHGRSIRGMNRGRGRHRTPRACPRGRDPGHRRLSQRGQRRPALHRPQHQQAGQHRRRHRTTGKPQPSATGARTCRRGGQVDPGHHQRRHPRADAGGRSGHETLLPFRFELLLEASQRCRAEKGPDPPAEFAA